MFRKIATIYNKIKRKRERKARIKRILKKCGSVCFCPKCREPLNDGVCKSLKEESVYQYTCRGCGFKPVFAFHIAPCPIYLEDYYEV